MVVNEKLGQRGTLGGAAAHGLAGFCPSGRDDCVAGGERHRWNGAGVPDHLALWHVVQQHVCFLPDHGITFAAQGFELGPVQYLDGSSLVRNDPHFLQFQRRMGHALATHTEHVRNEFLRHGQVVVRQTVHGQQQPAAKLLVDAVVAVAYGGLGDLCDQRLRVAQHQHQQLTVPLEFLFDP